MLALGRGIAVRGDVQPAAVVVVSGCVPEGGAFLVATILVVGSLERMPEPDAPEAEPPAAPEAGGAIEIRKNNQVVTLTSGGPAVTVRGNRNTVTLLGACAGACPSWAIGTRSCWSRRPPSRTGGNNNIVQQR